VPSTPPPPPSLRLSEGCTATLVDHRPALRTLNSDYSSEERLTANVNRQRRPFHCMSQVKSRSDWATSLFRQAMSRAEPTGAALKLKVQDQWGCLSRTPPPHAESTGSVPALLGCKAIYGPWLAAPSKCDTSLVTSESVRSGICFFKRLTTLHSDRLSLNLAGQCSNGRFELLV